MQDPFLRTRQLLGENAMKRLERSKVIIFGLGGVGSYAAEAIARSGIGYIDLVDNDIICTSNLNRQLIALHSTIGKYKADVCKERLMDINPNAAINAYRHFYLPSDRGDIRLTDYDYIIDAIDTVSAKIDIICEAKAAGVPVISVMGTGNKLDPSALVVTDISKTSYCPLARVMRSALKKRGITNLRVVYSKEKQQAPIDPELKGSGHPAPASNAFVPAVAGLLAADAVIKELAAEAEGEK